MAESRVVKYKTWADTNTVVKVYNFSDFINKESPVEKWGAKIAIIDAPRAGDIINIKATGRCGNSGLTNKQNGVYEISLRKSNNDNGIANSLNGQVCEVMSPDEGLPASVKDIFLKYIDGTKFELFIEYDDNAQPQDIEFIFEVAKGEGISFKFETESLLVAPSSIRKLPFVEKNSLGITKEQIPYGEKDTASTELLNQDLNTIQKSGFYSCKATDGQRLIQYNYPVDKDGRAVHIQTNDDCTQMFLSVGEDNYIRNKSGDTWLEWIKIGSGASFDVENFIYGDSPDGTTKISTTEIDNISKSGFYRVYMGRRIDGTLIHCENESPLSSSYLGNVGFQIYSRFDNVKIRIKSNFQNNEEANWSEWTLLYEKDNIKQNYIYSPDGVVQKCVLLLGEEDDFVSGKIASSVEVLNFSIEKLSAFSHWQGERRSEIKTCLYNGIKYKCIDLLSKLSYDELKTLLATPLKMSIDIKKIKNDSPEKYDLKIIPYYGQEVKTGEPKILNEEIYNSLSLTELTNKNSYINGELYEKNEHRVFSSANKPKWSDIEERPIIPTLESVLGRGRFYVNDEDRIDKYSLNGDNADYTIGLKNSENVDRKGKNMGFSIKSSEDDKNGFDFIVNGENKARFTNSGGLKVSDDIIDKQGKIIESNPFKIYNNVGDLGLDYRTCTIEEIVEKMPEKSILITSVGNSWNQEQFPAIEGILSIVKDNRVIIDFAQRNLNNRWIGIYFNGFSGWQKIMTEENSVAPYGKTIKLPDETNLDSVEKTGFYSVYLPVNAPKDAPSAGYLTVKRYNGTNMVMVQEYEQLGGGYGGNIPRSWKRICIAGSAYGEWIEQLSENNGIETPNGKAIKLQKQANLDTYITTGLYCGEQLVNKPEGSSSWGYVKVITYDKSGWVLQEYTEYGGTNGTGLDHQPRRWTRVKADNAWKSWVEQIDENSGIITPLGNLQSIIYTDLNLIQKSGLYYATSTPNRPFNSNGYLIHLNVGENYCKQIYHCNKVDYGGTYERTKYDDIWSPWVKQVDETNGIITPNGKIINLPTGTDLNTVLKTGFYDGDNLKNRPDGSTIWGYVKVLRYSGPSDWAHQTYIELGGHSSTGLNGQSRSWTRTKNVNLEWLPWIEQVQSNWKPLPLASGISTDTGQNQAMYCDCGNFYLFSGIVRGVISDRTKLWNLNHGAYGISATGVVSDSADAGSNYISGNGIYATVSPRPTSWVFINGIALK